MLRDWGMEISDDEQENEFDVCAEVYGTHVVRAVLNPDPLGRKPYYTCCFQEEAGSVWGKGLPEIIADIQDILNGCVRHIQNNLAICCLTGDTVVYRHEQKPGVRKRAFGKGAAITLNELWALKYKHNSGLRRNCVRSLDESTGAFYGNRIVDIYDNGVAPVFEVLTSRGYRIKATANHRFMDDTGAYRELSTFLPGDAIAVNGQDQKPRQVCVDCGKPLSDKPGALRCKSCASKVSTWNRKQALDALFNRNANPVTARARKLVRDQMKVACERCGATHPLELHHLDQDPLNCQPENLMTLCISCHNAWHVRHGKLGNPQKHLFVDYDTITSITPRGEERVFDLQMTAPNHNFVANGFVSHNSGPQVGLDLSKMTGGFDWQNMHPWKVWPFTSSMGTTPPITFFQPQSHVGELVAVFEKFDSISDDLTVPKYSYGNQQVVGAAATASGLSMLMNAANKRIKRVVAGMDRRVIRPLLERFYVFNMLYDEDESIKGDVQIVPRGAMALIVKEQLQMRRQEFMNATANPVDLQIIGIRGRARLLREVAQSLSIPVEKVVPSDEELEAQMKAAADQAAAATAAAATAGAVPPQPGAGVENAPVAGGAPAAEAMPGSAQAIPQ